jgi:acetate kinase
MKILVLNSGSSSIKFQLFNGDDFSVLAAGLVEKIGEPIGVAKITFGDSKEVIEQNIPDHKAGLDIVNDSFIKHGIIKDLNEITGVGHRVVQGGGYFSKAAIVNDEVQGIIKDLCELAPLHNPAALQGVIEAKKASPSATQVAVFDTAFHQTMPDYAYMYALPYEMYEQHKIRRYGAHGTSHLYVGKQLAKVIDKPFKETSLVTLHLGNGASLCAIKNGESVDTSMGFTPLEGVMMGTRTGDMDPAVVCYMQNKFGYTPKEMDTLMNKQSGLKGVCGHNDLREVLGLIEKGDKKAELALEMFCYRIRKYLCTYRGILGKIDAIVFTGGIGENAAIVRQKVCEGLEDIGLEIDSKINGEKIHYSGQTVRRSYKSDGGDEIIEEEELHAHVISKTSSPIKIYVIPTNEELEIAKQTKALLK